MKRDSLKGEPLEHVVAQRRLQVLGSDGSSRDVVVSTGQPRSDPRFGGDWSCVHQISGLGDDFTRTVVGVDGIQALMLTFQMVGITLRHIQAIEACASPGSMMRISGSLNNRSTPHHKS